MKFLISPNGSYGDVYPFIAIGRELQNRGHEVVLVTSGYFEDAITKAELRCEPVGTASEYERIIHNPDLTHPRRGMRVVADTLTDYLPIAYDIMNRLADDDTILIGSSLAFAAIILHEKHGIPWIPVHLAPSIFRSNISPPRVQKTKMPSWFPNALKNAVWWIGDRGVIDRIWCPGLNAFRRTIGLPPVRRIFKDWIHSPDLTIGLFPSWFAEPKPDWPKGVHLTDFPLYDQEEIDPDPAVEAFLSEGDPPVVFVSGTATTGEAAYYEASVAGCVQAGLRGLVLTRFPDQLPELPAGIRHSHSVPFSWLLPRCAAIVHHGGIGTTSQAMKAGIPQVIRPYGFDQFDNAIRASRLGVATEISTNAYQANRVATELIRVVGDEVMATTGHEVARRLNAQNTVAITCDAILGSDRR